MLKWIDHPSETLPDARQRRGVNAAQFIVPAFGQTVVLPPKMTGG